MLLSRRVRLGVSLLAGLAGLALFVHLLTTTNVIEQLRRLPAWFLLLIPAFGVVALVNTWSWFFAFPQVERSIRPPMRALFTIRLGGEAINNALASAYVAGEPVKGLLTVRYGTRPSAGLASALLGKTTNILGEVLFLIVGLSVAAYGLEQTTALRGPLLAVAGIGLGVVLTAIWIQRRRVFGRAARLLEALRLGSRSWWRRALPGADAIDDAVRRYYDGQRGDFALSTLWALAGWLLGGFELYVFLAVATPASDPLLLAVALESGIAVVKGLSFFIPGSIGAQEGGIAWLFQAVGLGADVGVTYAVFRRAREVVWIGLGFGALSWHVRHRESAAATRPAAEGGEV